MFLSSAAVHAYSKLETFYEISQRVEFRAFSYLSRITTLPRLLVLIFLAVIADLAPHLVAFIDIFTSSSVSSSGSARVLSGQAFFQRGDGNIGTRHQPRAAVGSDTALHTRSWLGRTSWAGKSGVTWLSKDVRLWCSFFGGLRVFAVRASACGRRNRWLWRLAHVSVSAGRWPGCWRRRD